MNPRMRADGWIAAAVVATILFAAIAVEGTTRVLAGMQVKAFQARAFEDLLPAVRLTIQAVQWRLHWAFAGLATLLILRTRRRHPRWFMPAAIGIAALAATGASAAALVMIAPFSYCGDLFPAWSAPMHKTRPDTPATGDANPSSRSGMSPPSPCG